MNAGFFNRAQKLREQQLQNLGSSRSDLWKLIPEKNKTYHITWLVDLSKVAPIYTHFVKGAPSRLCDGMYEDSTRCEDCEQINSFGNQNSPSQILPLIGYVHDLVGQKRTSKKNNKEYDENPVKLIEIPAGRGEVNLEALREYHAEGLMLEDVWEIERGDGGFREPKVADKRLLGRQFDATVPADILEKFSAMTPGEVMGLILCQYGNVKKDHNDFKVAGIVFPSATAKPEDEKEEEKIVIDEDSDIDLELDFDED